MSQLFVVVSDGVYASRPYNSANDAEAFREALIKDHGCERFNTRVEIFDNPEEELEDMRLQLEDANLRAEELEEENADLRRELDQWRLAVNR